MSAERRARIALVRPPAIRLKRGLSSYGAIPPIGLAYIAAVLRNAGHRLQIIDAPGDAVDRVRDIESPIGTLSLNGLTADEIVERIEPDTQVVGITHMFLHEWSTIREIAAKAKQRIPDIKVILGGENATSFHPWIFQQTTAVDYCVLGEGEAAAVELVERILAGATTDGVPGIASRTAGSSASNGLSERMTRIDEIPRPAWDLFPVEQYLTRADNYGVHRGRSIPMLATRGCPYQCTFCSSPQMWTTKYVTRSPREVVDEIKSYVETYAIDNVNFCDLTAIIEPAWILEFGNLLKQERLDITWQLPGGTRSEALDREVLSLIFETGCRNITYAPESGSERMLKILKKKVKLPRMLASLRSARKVGMVTRVNIIVGHPAEKWSDLLESVRFLIRAAIIGCQDTAVMIFAPYPGSADFERLLTENRLEMSEDYYYLALTRSGRSSRTYNARMTTNQLLLAQYVMLFAFYATSYLRRPWRFVNVVRALLTGQENTQLDQLLRTKFRSNAAVADQAQSVEVSPRGDLQTLTSPRPFLSARDSDPEPVSRSSSPAP
jgi:radical SAM superfamily enzyme YgiQ (UPF0313 family)